MPKDHKVIHRRHVISRILKAATDANYPVEQIEFTKDGTVILKAAVKPDAASSVSKIEMEPPAAA